MLRKIEKSALPGFNGLSAFDGALRFLSKADETWLSKTRSFYGDLFPQLSIFAEDAFGVLFGFDANARVNIFHSESADIEFLGIYEDEFYGIISDDPDGTIGLAFYRQCVSALGRPLLEEHFAFKVETALGGALETKNVSILNRIDHYRALGSIARQIHNVPVGTAFIPKKT
jgi:hypothetical protein